MDDAETALSGSAFQILMDGSQDNTATNLHIWKTVQQVD